MEQLPDEPRRLILLTGAWRVEDLEPGRMLRLRAEMKVPGRAAGLLYWYGLYPIHLLIFNGMLRGIATEAVRYPE